MINNSKLPKAYVEVLEFLKMIPKEEYDKVPNYIIKNMEEEKDNLYDFQMENVEDFSKQDLLEETVAILAVLFRDYWATDMQRTKIREIEIIERRVLEENKKRPLN